MVVTVTDNVHTHCSYAIPTDEDNLMDTETDNDSTNTLTTCCASALFVYAMYRHIQHFLSPLSTYTCRSYNEDIYEALDCPYVRTPMGLLLSDAVPSEFTWLHVRGQTQK